MSSSVETTRLCLRLFGRPVHPELVAADRSELVPLGRGSARVCVAAGGHAVILDAGGASATEVFGFAESDFGQPPRLERPAPRAAAVEWATPGLRYAASCVIDRVDPEVFERLEEEARRDAHAATVWTAGRGRNRLATAPLSLLTAEPVDGGLAVRGVHTFPRENAVVRTQSLFELVGL